MKTPEQPEPFRSLVDVRENERFVDQTGVGDLIVRVTHRLERVGQKTRIT